MLNVVFSAFYKSIGQNLSVEFAFWVIKMIKFFTDVRISKLKF